MNIIYHSHNEISWTIDHSCISINDIQHLVNILIKDTNWSRSITKRDRNDMHILLDMKNREFLEGAIECIRGRRYIPCKNSYDRLLCYLLSIILLLTPKKEVETTYERVCCMDADSPLLQRLGFDPDKYDCACDLIKKEYGNLDMFDSFGDFLYDLPVGKVVGVWCI